MFAIYNCHKKIPRRYSPCPALFLLFDNVIFCFHSLETIKNISPPTALISIYSKSKEGVYVALPINWQRLYRVLLLAD